MTFPEGKKIILFDGVCNLCDASVQFIIKHDKKDIFRFVALQSNLGETICKSIAVDFKKMDTIVLYDPSTSNHYLKSDAAIEIAYYLGNIFLVVKIFKIFPKFFRDSIYNYVSKNRYNWYGKKNHCLMPTPAISAKFL